MIPFLILLFLVGIPLFFLEVFLGQLSRSAPYLIFQSIHKKYTGVGLICVILTFNVCIYYAIVQVWCTKFLFLSFQWPLPWVENYSIQDSPISSVSF